MKVVESSSGRQLSPEEMKTLHDATIKFLAKQGESLLGGTYYVRVNFVPARPGEPGEWVLVQIISQPIDDYTRVAAYRDSSSYCYPGYASSRSSSYYQDYYYDPYENYSGGGYYHPAPVIPPQWRRPHDRDNDDKPHDRDDGKKPHDRDRGDHPPGTYAGGNNHDHDRDHNPRTSDNTPHARDSDRGRNHGSSNSNYEPATASTGSSTRSSGSSGNSSYSPPPASAYSPPPASAPSEPAPRHESGTSAREGRTPVRTSEN
jgi:hypothetical protein